MASFNLVREHWIPCILTTGQADERSLLEVLCRPKEILEMFDSSPLVTAALHRLLLAVLHRCFGPKSLAEWERIWERGWWDIGVVQDYLKAWEHRFDLFDARAPFYQWPSMTGVQASPVTRLAIECAHGNNTTLFDHSVEDDPASLSPAVAARQLLATQAYSIPGGVSEPFNFSSGPLTSGLTVLVNGRNLFETLMLNLVVYNQERPIPWFGQDLPCWERETAAEPDRGGTHPVGYLDYLTWQSRAVLLVPEGDPTVVRWCFYRQRYKLAGELRDPFKPYYRDEVEGLRPVRLDPQKALWRDAHTLFQSSARSQERAEVLNWVAAVGRLPAAAEAGGVAEYRISCFGLRSEGKAANVVLWRHERLPLPLAYLDDEKLLAKLKDALGLAETVASLFSIPSRQEGREEQARNGWPFRTLAALLLAPDRTARDQPLRNVVAHFAPGRAYWSRLEVPFKRLLVSLPRDVTESSSGEREYGRTEMPRWARTLRREAWSAFEVAVRGLDGSARSLRARAVAEAQFKWRIDRILRPYMGEIEEVKG